MLLCRRAAQLCLFPTLMRSRKCTGQFFQVLPGAGRGKGCAPGLPPRQPGCGATVGMGGGQGVKLVFRGILAGLTKGAYDKGCLQKRLGTAGPFLSHIAAFYVTRGGGGRAAGAAVRNAPPVSLGAFPSCCRIAGGFPRTSKAAGDGRRVPNGAGHAPGGSGAT